MLNTTVKLAGILTDSIVDGPGLRSVIFFQGCQHGCIGCHNQSASDYNGGTTYTIEQIETEINKNPLAKKLTISGGEPFDQYSSLLAIVKHFQKRKIWVYTGYTKEELEAKGYSEVFNYIEALVDGRFEKDLKTLEIPFVGSSNQRIHYFNQ